jgi:hypothetical protein
MPLNACLENNVFLSPHGNLCISALTLIPQDDLHSRAVILKMSEMDLQRNQKMRLFFRVSEDIKEMVDQIHAIQQDISDLAGRSISLSAPAQTSL